tara:strand:- start:27716 stop:27892 length:177 start_codon:yes stop_codon:yes gene_type:complete
MKYYDSNTMTYRNSDGSFKETYENKLKRELLIDKWHMRHALGLDKVEIENMLKEFGIV